MADAKTVVVGAREPFNVLTQLLLPEVALPVLIAARLPFSVKASLSLALLGSILHTFLTATTGVAVNDYALGSAVLGNTFFNVLLLVWLTDPMESFRYVRDTDPSSLASRSFLARVYNSLCIIRNYRLIGWNVQTANVPPPFKGTRAQFLLRRFLQFLWSFALTDLTESHVYPYYHLYVPGPTDPPLPTGFNGFFLRSWNLFVWLAMTYAILKMYYEAASLVAVGLGLGRPEDWPDMFGNWSDAYTLRRLWGRTWHQNLRRHFSYWGKLTVRALHIPRGTWLSSQVQVYTAFILSAFIHSTGDLMLGTQHFGRSFPFFLANAVAITFEDAIITLGKSLGIGTKGPTRVMRLVGYAWVVLWVRFSAPMYVDWMFESGVVENPVLPFSPTRSLVVPWLKRVLGSASLSWR
ncbi:membrane bound O-acyl transferase family-domain-containing protein [Cerioporus squamosus]|nr:membrane bound O-acyl transferase family-domain-containing protein [Cerioporus squamosus]